MQINLSNRRALVCGSTQGIGLATAEVLADAGAEVTLIARNQAKLQAACQQLPNPSTSATHRFLVADFSSPNEVQQVTAAAISENGPFDILVNNTGGPPGGPIVDASLAEFEAAFTQHLKCNHALATTLIPGMKAAGFGRIINVISTSVKQPLDGLGVSNTIRGAVANWAKTMANELGRFGITVNNVLPGATLTERLSSIIAAKASGAGVDQDAISEKMKSSIPAQRFAEANEIAYAITFLASSQASYINGINLPVDGGRTKCL